MTGPPRQHPRASVSSVPHEGLVSPCALLHGHVAGMLASAHPATPQPPLGSQLSVGRNCGITVFVSTVHATE